ncbi:uncharacterized protein LOC130789297 [Actinidia eriantha]|uniref:uncharacterized protein LOC130789297 n=1 Tax=Actinidia eriantha TaxID=165200 RepID=UPI002586EC3D|nr:uncharacterized protein LOC130789297 [Actinidia eriantha]
MTSWPRPQSLKALKGFLGLTGYYKRFIKNYRKICQPLSLVLKKDAFKWNSEAEQAFSQLKKAMTRASVLALPDYSKLFVLEYDASGKGVRAVLMQKGRPVAYYSKALSPTRLGHSTYEKELLAIVMAVTKWRLMKDSVTVVSSESTLIAVIVVLYNWVGALQDNWKQDDEIQQIIKDMLQDPTSHPHYIWQHDIMQRVGSVAYRLALPPTSKIHPVFHVSLLNKKLGMGAVVQTDLPLVAEDGHVQLDPVAILDRKIVKKHNKPYSLVLIQWSNSVPEDVTWESWHDIHQRFPQFQP